MDCILGVVVLVVVLVALVVLVVILVALLRCFLWSLSFPTEPISVPNVCSEHPETASLYFLFLALVEVFGDFGPQNWIEHVELL